jgi:hypothetical protein
MSFGLTPTVSAEGQRANADLTGLLLPECAAFGFQADAMIMALQANPEMLFVTRLPLLRVRASSIQLPRMGLHGSNLLRN